MSSEHDQNTAAWWRAFRLNWEWLFCTFCSLATNILVIRCLLYVSYLKLAHFPKDLQPYCAETSMLAFVWYPVVLRTIALVVTFSSHIAHHDKKLTKPKQEQQQQKTRWKLASICSGLPLMISWVLLGSLCVLTLQKTIINIITYIDNWDVVSFLEIYGVCTCSWWRPIYPDRLVTDFGRTKLNLLLNIDNFGEWFLGRWWNIITTNL